MSLLSIIQGVTNPHIRQANAWKQIWMLGKSVLMEAYLACWENFYNILLFF